jgi:hypothetical protein
VAGVTGDTAFQNPFTGAGFSADVQNLEGAAARTAPCRSAISNR